MRGTAGFLLVLGAAVGCGTDPIAPLDLGTLRVAIATGGADVDLDGYSLVVDDTVELDAGANETVVVPALTAGPHAVALTGLADNCRVDGTLLRSVSIVEDDTTRVSYAVTCSASGVMVTASTTGADQDADGYLVSVDGGTPGPLGATASLIVSRLAPGPHTVSLSGVAANCRLSGDNPRAVVVALGAVAPVQFEVACTATSGAVAVTAVATGTDLDPSFVIQLNGTPRAILPPNVTTVLTGVAPGTVVVTLADVAGNCALAGESVQTVTVTAGGSTTDTATAAFQVTCGATTGVLVVTTQTSGMDHDLDGYEIGLNTGLSASIGTDTTVAYDSVAAGDHAVTLGGTAANCTVAGANPQSVSISIGGAIRDTARVTFAVSCVKTWSIAYSRPAYAPAYGVVVLTIHLAGAGGAPQAAMIPGDAPSWSPDGTQVAYVSMTCDDVAYYYYYYCYPSGLSRKATDGAAAVPLTANGADADPAWKPDGTRIVFTRGTAMLQVNPDGSNLTSVAVAVPAAHPAWSPGGTTLAFTCEVENDNQDICTSAANGSGLIRLTSDSARDVRPAFSPDGSRIVFVTTRFTGSQELAVMNADGSGLTRLAPGVGALEPSWSADGSMIVFTSFGCDIYTGCTERGLAVINADGTGLAQVTTGRDHGAAWRP